MNSGNIADSAFENIVSKDAFILWCVLPKSVRQCVFKDKESCTAYS